MNVGYLRPARRFRILKFFLRRSRNPPCPASHESEPKDDSLWEDSLHVTRRVYRVSIVELYPLPHSKFFVILQCFGNLLRDFPEMLCFSYLILHIACSYPFELGQTIEPPDGVPFSGIQDVGQFHEEQYQHFAFPAPLPCDSLLQLDTNRSRLTTMCVNYQNN